MSPSKRLVPRFRLSTLLCAVAVAALLTVLAVQNQRIAATQRLVPGDVLAVTVPGILPRGDDEPPRHVATAADGERTVSGFPVVVMADGTISLPLLNRLKVTGKTVTEVQQLVEVHYQTVQPNRLAGPVNIGCLQKVTTRFSRAAPVP